MRRYVNTTWLPTDEAANLQAWFDASQSGTVTASGGGAIANGTTIQSWATAGGNSLTAGQVASIATPAWYSSEINGLSGIRFAANQILGFSSATGLQSLSGLTVILVAKALTSNGGVLLSVTNSARTFSRVYISMPNSTLEGGGRRLDADSYQSLIAGTVANGQVFMLTVVYDYAGATVTVYQNGSLLRKVTTFQTAGTSPASDPAVPTINGYYNASNSVQTGNTASYGEIIVIKRAIARDDLLGPHNRLANKWKL